MNKMALPKNPIRPKLCINQYTIGRIFGCSSVINGANKTCCSCTRQAIRKQMLSKNNPIFPMLVTYQQAGKHDVFIGLERLFDIQALLRISMIKTTYNVYIQPLTRGESRYLKKFCHVESWLVIPCPVNASTRRQCTYKIVPIRIIIKRMSPR